MASSNSFDRERAGLEMFKTLTPKDACNVNRTNFRIVQIICGRHVTEDVKILFSSLIRI